MVTSVAKDLVPLLTKKKPLLIGDDTLIKTYNVTVYYIFVKSVGLDGMKFYTLHH